MELVLEFIDQSSNFALGFEAGKVYQLMQERTPHFKGTYHKSNLEQFNLMARHLRYAVSEVYSLDDNFVRLQFNYV